MCVVEPMLSTIVDYLYTTNFVNFTLKMFNPQQILKVKYRIELGLINPHFMMI